MDFSGYTKMRLPNLVEHDTLHEVIIVHIILSSKKVQTFMRIEKLNLLFVQVTQQSMSWIPLLNIKCHADTQVMMTSDWLRAIILPSHWSMET